MVRTASEPIDLDSWVPPPRKKRKLEPSMSPGKLMSTGGVDSWNALHQYKANQNTPTAPNVGQHSTMIRTAPLSSLPSTRPRESPCTLLEKVLSKAVSLLPTNVGLKCLYHVGLQKISAVGQCIRVKGSDKWGTERWHTGYVFEVLPTSIICYFPNPVDKKPDGSPQQPSFCEIKQQPYYFVEQLTITTLAMYLSEASKHLPEATALAFTDLRCKELKQMKMTQEWLVQQRSLDNSEYRKSFFAELWRRLCQREKQMIDKITRLQMEQQRAHMSMIQPLNVGNATSAALVSISQGNGPKQPHAPNYNIPSVSTLKPPMLEPAEPSPRGSSAPPLEAQPNMENNAAGLAADKRGKEGAAFFLLKITEHLGKTEVPKDQCQKLAETISQEMRGPFTLDSMSKEQFWAESQSWLEVKLKEMGFPMKK